MRRCLSSLVCLLLLSGVLWAQATGQISGTVRDASGGLVTDAKVIVCGPGRNFVTLKITTEDGIYGLGDATLNGREL